MWYKQKQIFQRVTVKAMLLIIVLVFPLNILAMVNTFQVGHALTQKIQINMQNIAEVYITTLDHRIERADSIIYKMYAEDADTALLLRPDDETTYINSKFRVWYKLFNEHVSSSAADGYFFLLKDTGDLILSVNSVYNSQKSALKEALIIPELTDKPNKWSIWTLDEQKWLIRSVDSKNCFYGTMICLSVIEAEILENISYDNVSADFVEIVSESADGAAGIAYSQRGRVYMQIEVPDSVITSNMPVWYSGGLVLVCLYLGLIPLLYILSQRWLTAPIKRINAAHHHIEQGNPNYRITDKASTLEFQTAYDSFNKMADSNYFLRMENAEKEIKRQEMELENLQLQIRPHFLFNTFNLISNLAQRGEADSIRTLIRYLADYFRYLFHAGQELEPFERELELIQGYMHAAAIRYPEGFVMNYQIDPDVLAIRVPPLLIHNFMENIINHALVKGKTISITLSAMCEEDNVIFQISDNGRGMDQEIAEEINQHNFKRKDGRIHVGIQNAIRRLSYFYGEKTNLQVISYPEKGSAFTITIPYLSKEDKDETVIGK